ncbi:MFS transporter [Weissella confusa]|uniref:MFS transporter n=1 Tax=Weissella confusa TaxID=1583 RepID=UPI001C6FB16E|nr:MFS transporter [Weissella confusa]QYU56738.1 MFS transporter [Weissella confusa]
MLKKNMKLSIFMIGIFLCMLDTTVMNVALPQISESFNTQLNDLSWALNIYTILFASLTIPLTRIAERFGMNRLIILGFIVFGVGSLISGEANGINALVFGRGIQSVGAALIFPLSMTLGINLVDTDKRTGIIAALGVTQGLAAALGPVIGGIITQYLSWRWIFFINLPFVILTIVMGLIVLDLKSSGKNVTNFDFFGSIFSISFLLSLTTLLTQGRSWGWQSSTSILMMVLTMLFFVAFVFGELKSKNPMIPLDLFKNKNFNGSAIVIILSNLFLVAVTVILPTFYTNIEHYDALRASFMLVPITLFIFIMSPIAGFALKILGPKILISFGFLLMTIGYVGYATNGLDSQMYSVLYGSLVGAGYGLITGPITVIAASDFTGNLLSSSQSVSGVLRQVGTVLAVAIFVTGLYTNISTSQQDSFKYVNESIDKLAVPRDVKTTLITKSKAGIQSSKNTKLPTKHTGIEKIDQTINGTLFQIKKYATNNAVQAFKRLYKASVPVLMFVVVFMLVFWKNNKNNIE